MHYNSQLKAGHNVVGAVFCPQCNFVGSIGLGLNHVPKAWVSRLMHQAIGAAPKLNTVAS
ncbi:hypothetical protein BDR03DRAFT_937519, partial [Suillus americanus]